MRRHGAARPLFPPHDETLAKAIACEAVAQTGLPLSRQSLDDLTTRACYALGKPISREMLDRDLARLAYVAADGTQRVVPIGLTWNGTEVVMCTTTNAPKLASLRRNPAVALTIDTEVHPPTILLLRGEAVLDEVEGIPDEYLRMNGTYEMTAEQRVEWEAEVRSLYDSMVRIVVTPTWAKLIDFETTLPSAVEELVRQREERQRA
jgi:hypothetical protein